MIALASVWAGVTAIMMQGAAMARDEHTWKLHAELAAMFERRGYENVRLVQPDRWGRRGWIVTAHGTKSESREFPGWGLLDRLERGEESFLVVPGRAYV